MQIIPISVITVENPRERSEKTFRALVDSIGKVGLKKPITVARVDDEAGVSYRLVCGQGRMEAYVALGETHFPATVVDAKELRAPRFLPVFSAAPRCDRFEVGSGLLIGGLVGGFVTVVRSFGRDPFRLAA